MKNLKYKIFNPGGNKTGLVYNDKYSDEEKKKINDIILKKHRDVEQVGFIENNSYELNMAGGEFCANATRCAVYEYLQGKDGKIEIQVSGQKEKIIGDIANGKVSVTLKINQKLEEIYQDNLEYSLVNLDGIDFMIYSSFSGKEKLKLLKEDEDTAKNCLKEEMKQRNLLQNAVGIILLEEQEQKVKINPVVWVKTIDTVYYETACGSGSLATAIYYYLKENKRKLQIFQPSGYSIDVELIIENDIIKDAKISGIVEKS